MQPALMRRLSLLPVCTLLLLAAACGPAPTPTPADIDLTTVPSESPQAAGESPVRIHGEFSYSNEFVTETYYVEQAVALVDMTGFVLRDKEWTIPVASQVLGFMDLDADANQATFFIDLPARPEGQFNDVDQDGQADQGVQIFAAAYSPNLSGGPYSEGDDVSEGWPAYLASVTTDTENEDEVTGGKLMVWAPDDQQQFPTGFGADGLLFTADDPVGPLPAGYTAIDLDQQPFAQQRVADVEMTLYEPQDVAIKDFSGQSYQEAFDSMFAVVRKEYAFNGIPGKQPDWDSLYDQVEPLVAEAQSQNDAYLFYRALHAFTLGFHDGHVGLDGGDYANQYFAEIIRGGYGLAIRETDDGQALVTYVLDGGPAAQAGIQVGAEITTFNDQPVGDAIGQVDPPSGPFSTDYALRTEQERYLLRATPGDQATLTFANPSQAARTVTLEAVSEHDSFLATFDDEDYDPNALPVEFRILDSGAGYVRINSNYDDLNLIVRLFERALQTFAANDVPGIIIDMRQNSGGASLGLAGYLTGEEIPLGQLEYYSDKTGQFEPSGVRETVRPMEEQYSFDRMALLVSQTCYSACEIEAYGFSQVPGMLVIGQYPTGGVEAEVARGQFSLPAGITLQVPTGRFTLPDGSIFLEGVGVQPTLRVPIDADSLLSDQDVVLQTAEEDVLRPAGAGIEPAGPPTLAGLDEAESALRGGATPAIEDLAGERYDSYGQAGQTYTYTVALEESRPLLWLNGWCGAD
ncbi:MAG: hypothetical protein GYA17_22110, partial [Chloroflexi bacterium]|nr:hypothetical protein [Chloroflexota bacterium]